MKIVCRLVEKLVVEDTLEKKENKTSKEEI